ncbi:hypothetical protein RDWZM_009249 [Blomia tropicalis]|uniref:Mediator of RNA polymerase II transcription subunit 6 n=1 Tax=Blomia tropicalis TaxID=40697 RepID=A0A9Q0M389_BLOTA|nr:Mediator of RNA polymerase II transcription subunit 6 [Blomia tropicalis]KAJ6218092.1 hypothetical protein RDWZM_009249 [Blomia tropicalis]
MNDRVVENPLSLSWCDRASVSILNVHNILTYFAGRTNPFYDHTCNNEMLRMRGLRMDCLQELEKMQGVEYVLLHAQEPILYVIRKQKRLSPTTTTPLVNYYIIAGMVYQAPDLQSIIQSKMLTAIHYLQSAFDECFQYARFHPSTDYYWNFSKDGSSSLTTQSADETKTKESSKSNKDEANKKKELSISEVSDSARHMYRVDVLIHELVKKFPLKIASTATNQNGEHQSGSSESGENANQNGNDQSITESSNTMDVTSDDDKNKSLNTNTNQFVPPTKKTKLN